MKIHLENITLWFIVVIIITMEALSDSYFYLGQKEQSKTIFDSMYWIAIVCLIIFVNNGFYINQIWRLFLAWILLRFSLFDLIFNYKAGLAWNYCGTTAGWYSDIMSVIKPAKIPYAFLLMLTFVISNFMFIRDIQSIKRSKKGVK